MDVREQDHAYSLRALNERVELRGIKKLVEDVELQLRRCDEDHVFVCTLFSAFHRRELEQSETDISEGGTWRGCRSHTVG